MRASALAAAGLLGGVCILSAWTAARAARALGERSPWVRERILRQLGAGLPAAVAWPRAGRAPAERAGSARDPSTTRLLVRRIEARAAGPDADASADLALVRALEGRFDAARNAIERARELAPTRADFVDDLGAILLARALGAHDEGALVEAIDWLGRRPDSPPSHRNLLTALRAGRLDRQAARLAGTEGPAAAAATSSWDGVRAQGLRLADAGATEELRRLVRAESRRWRGFLERELLPAWAAAVAAGDDASRGLWQERARALGAAFAAELDDRFAAAVAARLADEDVAERRARAAAIGRLERGTRALDAYRIEEAEPLLTRASRDLRGGSVELALAAEAQRLACVYQRKDFAPLLADARKLAADARGAGFPALQARALWLEGLSWLEVGDPARAIAPFERSLALFSESADRSSGGFLHLLLANALARIGDRRTAIAHLVRAVDDVAAARDLGRLPVALAGMARELSLADRPRAALFYQEEATAYDLESGDPLNVAESLWQLGSVAARAGDLERAAQSLAAAADWCARIPSAEMRDRTAAGIELERARVEVRRDPRRALERIERTRTYYESRGYGYLDVDLRLLESEAALASGDEARAERALAASARRVADGASAEQDPGRRALYLDQLGGVLERWVAFEADRRADPLRALARSERAKSLLLRVARGGPEDLASRLLGDPDRDGAGILARAKRLPATVAVIAFEVLDDRILAWALYDGRLRSTTLSRGRAWINETAERAAVALAADDRPATSRELDELSRVLLSPFAAEIRAATELVISANEALESIPWAALQDPAGTGALIDGHALVQVQSLLPAAASATSPAGPSRNALVVSDPIESPTRGSAISLPQARLEGFEVARLLSGAALLDGAGATPEAVLSRLTDAALVHVAAHAGADASRPWSAWISLTASVLHPDGHLTATDLARLDLAGTELVYLSSCSSGRGTGTRALGQLALSSAFLAAGAQRVVASLWDLEDGVGLALARAFYRRLAAGEDAAKALRGAQLELRRSTDPGASAPRAWAALQLRLRDLESLQPIRSQRRKEVR